MERSDSEYQSYPNKRPRMEDSRENDDPEILVIDLTSTDTESDSNCDDVPESANVETPKYPVLSLQCLHSDSDAVDEDENQNSDEPERANNDTPMVNDPPVLSLQCLHEDDDDSNSLPVRIVAVRGSVGSSQISQPHAAIPASNNWEGAHNFRVAISCNEHSRKAENTIFSERLNKLYVTKDHPFRVHVYAENVPSGSRINVSAVYSLAEHSYALVQRCPTHVQADFAKGNPLFEYLIQSVGEAATYFKCPDTGKLNVSVPYEEPQEGENYTTYLLKLTCYSSCSGGINRRPFLLVFSLENDNNTLGRQTIETKVCACPQRDYRVDVNKENPKRIPKEIPRTESPNASSADGGGPAGQSYTLTVQDHGLYKFLVAMKAFYEMASDAMKIRAGQIAQTVIRKRDGAK